MNRIQMYSGGTGNDFNVDSVALVMLYLENNPAGLEDLLMEYTNLGENTGETAQEGKLRAVRALGITKEDVDKSLLLEL